MPFSISAWWKAKVERSKIYGGWLFFLTKLASTIHILFTLGCARTFGQYIHSGWNGEFAFCRYEWRGKEWVIPTSPAEDKY